MKTIKVGCCGFPRRMDEYFAKFEVVEVQKTFYQLPSVEVVERWRSLAPQNFEFTVKAWQGITHPATSPTYRRFKGELKKPENYGYFKQTEEVIEGWRKTEEICNILKTRFVLFQCPASFKPTDENLENIVSFFKGIKREGLSFVWEPRGKEWKDEIVLEVCKKCNLIHAVDPFARKPVTEKTAYFRLHGSPPGKRMYYYNYRNEDLKKLLDMCKPFKEVYCFFNNLSMFQDASKFAEMVQDVIQQ